LLQDTFVQLHKARHTFNPDLRVVPWAYGIARHAFLMGRRTRSRRAEINGAAVDDTVPSCGPTPEERVVTQSDLERGLSALAPGVRLTILLHDLVGLDFADIAARLGIGSGAARLWASRGRAAARRAIHAGDDDGR
jgi:RNA polymerase sigma-70 factor (ECF subfamily)